MSALSELSFFTNEHNVLIVLLFYFKNMPEKATMQRTHDQLSFFFVAKRPMASWMHVWLLEKTAIEWGIDFTELRLFLKSYSFELHEIWHENTLENK